MYNLVMLLRPDERKYREVLEQIRLVLQDIRGLSSACLDLVRKIHQHHESSEHESDKTHQHGTTVQPSIRSVVELPPEFVNSYKAEQRQNSRRQRRQTTISIINLRVQRRLASYTLGGFIAAALYATISLVQWWDLRQQFQIQQRAWIGYSTMALTNLKDEEPLMGDIKIINSGNTFALDVSMPGGIQTSWIGLEDAQRQLSQKSIGYVMPHSKVLFPKIEVNLPFQTNENLTPPQVAAVRNGTLHVYLFTDILYHDIFGRLHRTHFCGHYVARTNRFEDCGTEAD